jgi:hypothetical protein
MPGVRIPSFPLGGAILAGLSMHLLKMSDHAAIDSSDVKLRVTPAVGALHPQAKQ